MGAEQSKLPEFSLTASRYDMSTYLGRIKHFQDVTDVTTLFTTQVRVVLKSIELYGIYFR